MTKHIAAALITLFPCLLAAGGFQNGAMDLARLRAADLRGYDAPVQAPAPPTALPQAGPADDDAVLNALSASQWESILGSEPWSPAPSAKELLSDFQIRYIARGDVSFRTEPPTFTTVKGKKFILTDYPKWLRELGDRRVCVEGYIRQRDDTRVFRITRMLPPEAMSVLERTPEMREVERNPYVMARPAGKYLLGNVSWNLKHDDAGNRVKDKHGNMITEWQTGVTVDPSLLENAYFVKKSDLKPVKHGGHGLLMFTFKPGGVVTADGRRARGLTLTLDGYHKGLSESGYDIMAALKGKYTVYYTIQTMERYTEFRVAERPEVMALYPLLLTRAQRLKLLDSAIAKAVEDTEGEMYNLLYNSCANSILSIINGVLEEHRKIKDGWLPEIIYRIQTAPPDAIAALLLKKNIARSPLPEVNAQNWRQTYGF